MLKVSNFINFAILIAFTALASRSVLAQYSGGGGGGYGGTPVVPGNVSVSLNQTLVSINAGSSGAVAYTVNLISGTSSSTLLNVVNYQQLLNSGISVLPSRLSGNPPFSGKLNINVGPAVKPGNYSIIVNATGGGDLPKNNTVLRLIVLQQMQKQQNATTTLQTTSLSTSITVQSASSTPTSTAVTTTIQAGSTSSQASIFQKIWNAIASFFSGLFGKQASSSSSSTASTTAAHSWG